MFKQTLRKRDGENAAFLFFSAYNMTVEIYDEAIEWCIDHYGDPGFVPEDGMDRWGHHGIAMGRDKIGTVWFRDEHDAIEFKLRWV